MLLEGSNDDADDDDDDDDGMVSGNYDAMNEGHQKTPLALIWR